MLDTIKLLIPEYQIGDTTLLQVQPSQVVAGTGEKLNEHHLFNTSSGKNYYGSRAFLNTDTWHLDIKPFSFSETGTACFLHFSIPKIYHSDNFYSVGEQGAAAVINQVEKELFTNGIHCNLQDAEFSRIDTFKNVNTEEPAECYFPLFDVLNISRTKKVDYGTTYLMGNKQQQFCIYDKLQEMRKRNVDISNYPETMRFEHRLLNKQKIKTTQGFTKVSELFSGGYASLKDKVSSTWKDSLFKYSLEDVMRIGSKELEQEMKSFEEKHGRNWLSYFLRSYGSYHLAMYAGKDVLELAMKSFEPDRMKVYRMKKTIEEAERELKLYKQAQGSSRTYAALYEELKQKVCLN